MDLDRYLATHRPDWERLDHLTTRGGRRAKKLSAVEVDELVGLYQQTSANLSLIRTYYRDPALIAQLTRRVSAAGSVIYGTRPRTLRALGSFFSDTFPAATWRCRRFVAAAAAFLLLPAIVVGIWMANAPDALDADLPPEIREAYVNEEFESYYESERAAQFGSDVFINNVQVAITAFASGIAFGIPTVLILVFNGAQIGFIAGMFAAVGQAPKFWGLITPHGLLEITAVIFAGGTGLQLGWSLVAPGDRSRRQALGDEGQRLIVIVLGLVPVFLVAGIIEGFVTGQPWPTSIRVGIGVIAWAAFLAYLYVQGRTAAARGLTGAFGENDERGWAISRRGVPAQ